MQKLLSIKEFAEFSGIESSTLRYWDEVGILIPAQRDEFTNYRYYSPDQIFTANFIVVLSDLKVPLKTISQLCSTRTPNKIMRLIHHQEKSLDMEMRKLREHFSIIHIRQEMIALGNRVLKGFSVEDGVELDDDELTDKATKVDVNKIAIIEQHQFPIILGPRNQFTPEGSFYEPLMHFCRQASAFRINLNYPIGGFHDNFEHFVQNPGQPHHFYSVDPDGNYICKGGKYVVGFHQGYYGDFGDLPDRMAKFIKDNSLTTTGPVLLSYLHDEICVGSATKFLAQGSVAIAN